MHLLIALDSFKGCLSSTAAGDAVARGGRRAGASCDVAPVADGGEGTLAALGPALGVESRRAAVTGPNGTIVEAAYGLAPGGGPAIVELAEASGLQRITGSVRDPAASTTYGTGELVARALAEGAGSVIVGLGGSATIDGGAGLAQALGVVFLDDDGAPLPAPMRGRDLGRVARVERPARLPRIIVAADVDNPLCGPHGAAVVYGPQKGATPDQIESLDADLARLARLVGVEPNRPHFGAAGGAGFGLAALLGAELRPGAELVLEAIDFAGRCAGADLVVTGEGRLDAQTERGKLVARVAAAARGAGVPVVAVAGSADPAVAARLTAGPDAPLRAVIDLTARFGPDRARHDTRAVLEEVGMELGTASSDGEPTRR